MNARMAREAVEQARPADLIDLLNKGLDPDIGFDGGFSLLALACKADYPLHAAALLAAGADVDSTAGEFGSPLGAAASFSFLGRENRCILLLVEAGAKVDSKAVSGRSPLMLACDRGNVENIKALLGAGADPYEVDMEDCNAMVISAWARQTEAVGALLEAGIDPRAKPEGAISALDVAKHSERPSPKCANWVRSCAAALDEREAIEKAASVSGWKEASKPRL